MIRKIVKFKKHWHVYQPGEVAGFPENQVTRLVNAGYAEVVRNVAEDGMSIKHIASDAAKVKAMTEPPAHKAMKVENTKGKSKKKRGRPAKKLN